MQENNKLIAEFMGYPNIAHDEDKRDYLEDCVKYHKSWDWLMPVANEIIKSRDEQNTDWDLTDLKYALQTTNIELVYKAVVEFIKECKKYPFNEGDDYYTIEDGEVIWSCWDEMSEELHNDNPNKQYFKIKKEAENYNQNNQKL